MALPTTIDGTNLVAGSGQWYAGPFLSSAGNVYVLAQGNEASPNNRLRVYKASDPTASFARQDASNEKITTTRPDVWCVQSGDTLLLCSYDQNPSGGGGSRVHSFSMATDTWSSLNGNVTNTNITPSRVCLVVRSNGHVVALGQTTAETLMGTSRRRVSYIKSTDGGDTWGSAVAVGATGVKRDIYGGIAILGKDDRVHFFYSDTTANAKHRSLSSADALDTEAAVSSPATASETNFKPGISYASGSDVIVKVPVNGSTANRLSNTRLTSGANPTINLDANFTDANVKANVACYAVDGTTLHAVWSRASDDDLMRDIQKHGDSFGTDTVELAATVNAVSANIYTRSGSKVLAYLYDDGGTVKYNEIVLSSSGFTLDAAPGSYALAGAVAGTLATRVLNASPGTYTLTGHAAQLAREFLLAALAGAYAITGLATALQATRVLNATTGTYALTGIAANLARHRFLDANPGVYALTGSTASLTRDAILHASSGSYVLTGNEARTIADRILATDSGVYVLTGIAAELVVDIPSPGFTLIAEPGIYALTGTSAGLVATRVLIATPGNYTLTGHEARTVADRVLAADIGSYLLQGHAVGTLADRLLHAAPGTYVLTGANATPLVDRLLHAAPGVYTLDGVDAVLVFDGAPTPSGGIRRLLLFVGR